MRRIRAIVAAIVFALTASFGITSADQFLQMRAELAGGPTQTYSTAALFDDLVSPSEQTAAATWNVSPPTGLRPCCALGHNLGVAVGPVPVPIVRLDNVIHPNALGRHRYNSNLINLAIDRRTGLGLREQNGILYTCGGGVIDTAHIRDYADLTVYLYSVLEPRLGRPQTIELPDQAGRRFVQLHEIAPELLERVGRRTLALELAGWISFQLSIWHETASWYGWSSVPLFPETVSAFSPEDLYTNVLGIRLAFALIRAGRTATQQDYERAMDESMPRLLARLGAMPAALSRSVLSAIDGVWWTSTERLPHREVVQLRSFDTGPHMVPLRVPRQRLHETLGEYAADYCAAWQDRPVVLEVPTRAGDVSLSELATVEIEPMRDLADDIAAITGTARITHDDLPRIVENIAAADRQRTYSRSTAHSVGWIAKTWPRMAWPSSRLRRFSMARSR
ncbi:MAG TPA: DUF4056 domain-containing protein [Candidatus Limnocylindrales bacterium]|nr:DUF4056 domain-containing protein [Candidatus Limnocylindrales bacterium]